LRAATPEARVEQLRAEAKLVKPTAKVPAERDEVVRDPVHPAYDPFLRYYPSPMGMMLDVMILSSFMHALHPSPAIFVTNPQGANLGSAEQVAAEPERLEADSQTADVGDSGSSSEGYGDAGDGDHGGGWDDGGGGFDSGGLDGGGFDGGDFGGD
jgi:hypothetical protein